MRTAVLGLALLLLVAFVVRWDWWVGSAIEQTTNDAYLQSDTTPLAAQVSGIVRSVPVGDFQRVKAGDPLAVIADDEYRARVAGAEAALEAADSAIALLDIQKRAQQALIDQADANAHGLEADAWRARLEEKRQQELSEQGGGRHPASLAAGPGDGPPRRGGARRRAGPDRPAEGDARRAGRPAAAGARRPPPKE